MHTHCHLSCLLNTYTLYVSPQITMAFNNINCTCDKRTPTICQYHQWTLCNYTSGHSPIPERHHYGLGLAASFAATGCAGSSSTQLQAYEPSMPTNLDFLDFNCPPAASFDDLSQIASTDSAEYFSSSNSQPNSPEMPDLESVGTGDFHCISQ